MSLPPLPEGWSLAERVADTVDIAGLTVHRAGVSSVAPTGEELTGAAAALDGPPEARAYFELLERIGTFEAIAHGRPFALRDGRGNELGSVESSRVFPRSEDEAVYREARSNGVALHETWQKAAESAHAELVERDHVLRSWHGLETPRRIDLPSADSWAVPGHLVDYDWRAYVFPLARPVAWAADVCVCGIFGLPKRDDRPLLAGYGARRSTDEALLGAATELTQSLAFLWGEEIPSTQPAPAPHAGTHLEWSLHPANRQRIAAWLDGAHRAYAPSVVPLPQQETDAPVTYADLTPGWLAGRAHLARALHPAARRLVFGRAPDTQHLPPELRIHPVG